MSYKIKMVCVDPPYNGAPYMDEINKSFRFKEEAQMEMLECAIDDAESLNEPDAEYQSRTNIFVLCRNREIDGKQYDVAITLWDGAAGIKEQLVTGYFVEWVNENQLDEFNRRLRDQYGDHITVEICSEMGLTADEDEDVDEHEVFFFTSAMNGESDRFATAEAAYENAVDYMECGLLCSD